MEAQTPSISGVMFPDITLFASQKTSVNSTTARSAHAVG